MEKYKNPVIALLSVVVFWLLAVASSPQIGQSVDCDKLPTPTTKTFTIALTAFDLETLPPLKGVTVVMEQKNLASVMASETDCKVEVVSSFKSQQTTSENGKVVFTVTETKKSPYDHVQVFFTLSKQGYHDATWSFSSHTADETTYARSIILSPKEIYP